MEKEFIHYELALELKELGFDENCLAFYDKESKLIITGISKVRYSPKLWTPTFSQAFRWFREKYHIIGEVKFKGGKTTKTAWYDYVIYSEIDWNDENPNEQWKKHEEAELECLKKLIEIVKEK
jgi:hypothetical protein